MFRLGDTKLWVGGREASSLRDDPDWAVVNATKSVHSEILGWVGKPSGDDPYYLMYESGQLLSFNWVDGGAHTFEWSGVPAFVRALDFIDKWYESKDILINCDQGQSRSPTVALLYLAKRMHLIPDESFAEARKAFQIIYPFYAPNGIADYVSNNWSQIN